MVKLVFFSQRYLHITLVLLLRWYHDLSLYKVNHESLDRVLCTFYFKCYPHHNCRVNLNWNNTQLYSPAEPFRNVPCSVFWFVNFCFLSFLFRTSALKWKKNWFCYVHKWIGKKELSAKISKCLCRNLFIGTAAQIRAVYEDHEILVTL